MECAWTTPPGWSAAGSSIPYRVVFDKTDSRQAWARAYARRRVGRPRRLWSGAQRRPGYSRSAGGGAGCRCLRCGFGGNWVGLELHHQAATDDCEYKTDVERRVHSAEIDAMAIEPQGKEGVHDGRTGEDD